jgi:predicted GTPase
MSLQCEIEDKHRNRHMKADVLARSVEEVFCKYNGIKWIANIHTGWKEGLELIILGKGGNDLVE